MNRYLSGWQSCWNEDRRSHYPVGEKCDWEWEDDDGFMNTYAPHWVCRVILIWEEEAERGKEVEGREREEAGVEGLKRMSGDSHSPASAAGLQTSAAASKITNVTWKQARGWADYTNNPPQRLFQLCLSRPDKSTMGKFSDLTFKAEWDVAVIFSGSFCDLFRVHPSINKALTTHLSFKFCLEIRNVWFKRIISSTCFSCEKARPRETGGFLDL